MEVFCGIVWRVFKRRLYDSKNISSLVDARVMFNMTQLTMNSTHEQNEIFLDIMQDLLDRSTGFETGVSIPIDRQSANEILMESKFGIFGNLPHEEVFQLEGHACVLLIGILKHLFAHKILIGFTEQTDIEGDIRDRSCTNGCPAMEELLKYMKMQNPGNKPTKYGSFILWSEALLDHL